MPSTPSLKKACTIRNTIGIKSSKRKSRLKFDFPIETLVALSQFRQDEAAKILGVASITLKRNCQRQKYRWPYRTIKAQRRREARLTAQKTNVDKAFTCPSSPPPQLLLSLKSASLFSTSPSSISSLVPSVISSSKPMARPQFSRAHESTTSKLPQLPPLKLLLRYIKMQSRLTTSLCLTTTQSMQHLVEHTNLYDSASFHPTEPNVLSESLSAPFNHCQCQARLPSIDTMQAYYKNF
ncbi:unnamed protein product [Peronospora belbahrii]|uniref:RWP-RK domain-containing protein n=1 Tax=Peronospora belbahrii TaxID=622444 RepID=A0AAU9KM43_9STRA|nr:unnamed protein product [Peronospora belbahrii]